MKPLVVATSNPGKLRELLQLFNGTSYELHPQSEFAVPGVPETGTTFVENAIIKARNAAQHTGFAAIADDSGIEVDALNGEPGVYSARFAGIGASDAENNALLVERLSSVPDSQRTARYRAVIVLMRNLVDPAPLICEGSWEGKIILEPRGKGGFGYDPYFYLPDQGCTSAELSAETKNQLSHRGQALRALMHKLPL